MGSRIRQLFVYTKVTFLIAVFLAVLLFIFMNRRYDTRFWPGATETPVSTLWLMLITSCVSIISFWLLGRVRRVWKEVRQTIAEREQESARKELQSRERALGEQERRIDEKLQKALGEDNSQA